MYIELHDRDDLERKTKDDLIKLIESFQTRILTDSEIKIESDHYHLSIELETDIPKS